MVDFGKKVRMRREALGMTQGELAEKVGYKERSAIAKIESGVNDPTLSKVADFAEALSVDVSYFADWQSSRSFALGMSDAKLIKKYHLLSEANKQVVLDLINSLIEAQNKPQL